MAHAFEVVGVDHVSITAPAELEDEVLRWYRECLGLKQISKPEGARRGGAWFQVGGQQIHISIDEHNPHKAAHFGIVVDDYTAVIDTLRAQGCHIEQAMPIPGRRRFFARDPAGNSIEIMGFSEEAPVDVHYQEVEAP